MKANKWLPWALAALGLINIVATVFALSRLPETVAVHYNIHLVADRYGSRWALAWQAALPLIGPLVLAIVRRRRGEGYQNQKTLEIMCAAITVLFIALYWCFYVMSYTYSVGQPSPFRFDFIICMIFGLLFIVMGNYMPTVRPNHMLGLRIPATLGNGECWRRTHHFGGKVMVIAGVVLVVLALVGLFTGAQWLEIGGLIGCVLGMVLITTVYAYRILPSCKPNE